ncbi:alpha-galactosidase [Lacticaseibacillus rhamnosus]|nr:alpha-galactosidase [Lacticaseibacillus rhamnosus]ONG02046.1 alpha-galactosidase [Lacticaseibacillus rhamnosus]OXS93420.1 alpha-galactosidase [Lacticaseibacillus rhamnosus]OXT06012.1 alpha-galactosidase [Lacticaseibacillus rhamnosus]
MCRFLTALAHAQLTITRSPAQKSACKDLERAGQDRAITLEATYTPTSNRAGSRSAHHNALPGAETCT